jgi:transcriptional regulator with GAF, ATPase, and Fis domain
LSHSAALEILLERRGSMYDPLIVDTFVRVHHQIEPALATSRPPTAALQEITSSHASNSPIPPPLKPAQTPITSQGAGLDGLFVRLSNRTDARDVCETIEKHLRLAVPFSLLILYRYETASDDLAVGHAIGDIASAVQGSRIAVGERISGWVAANRVPILNSDSVLALGQIAKSATPQLRSCLSVPLVFNNALVGVLSLHAAGSNSFTDDHQRIVEAIAIRTAPIVGRAVPIESRASAYRDANVAIGRNR